MIDPALYDKAREHIAAAGFTASIQTRIALVLATGKNANLMFNATLQWMPATGVARQFFISQAARETEALSLLASTTNWDGNPGLALRAYTITAPLTKAWSEVMMPPGPAFNGQAAYRGVALGHAQLSRLRLAPIIPEGADPLDPFVVALQRIEQENGRMLQTQIRLLKSVGSGFPLAEREALVEKEQELVDGVVNEFLAWLAAP